MKSFFADTLRLFMGAVYLTAGCLKALEFYVFLDDLNKFGMVPAPFLVPAAIGIIGAEVFFGFSLIVKFRTSLMALFLGMMTCTFTIALLILALRNQNANCGCFGTWFPEKVGAAAIIRDMIFSAGCFWLAINDRVEESSGKGVNC